jgi:hypothetical protein
VGEWQRFFAWLAGSVAALLALAAAAILLLNPYGNLPSLLRLPLALVDGSQRYVYPAVARSGRYDSLVIGTSTGRLLDPARLEAAFGGRFANLSLNNGMAWEQAQIADVFLKAVPRPRTLLVTIDYVWCHAEADTRRTEPHLPFPEWMYDDTVWNDLPYMLNAKALGVALDKLLYHSGLKPTRFAHNGYGVFTPPESQHDLAKVRAGLGDIAASRRSAPHIVDVQDAERGPEGWRFPALAWLDGLLARAGPGTEEHRRLVVMMPVHVATQPDPALAGGQREAECKRRIAEIGARHGAHVVDFRIASPITTRDENYWDGLHYRVPVGHAIVESIARAAAARRDDPAGTWRYLAGPAAQ